MKSLVNQYLEEERVSFLAKLNKALCSPYLADWQDNNRDLLTGKLINLFEQLAQEKNRHGLWSVLHNGHKNYEDPLIIVCRSKEGADACQYTVLQTEYFDDLFGRCHLRLLHSRIPR
jgi:hypothetical protein